MGLLSSIFGGGGDDSGGSKSNIAEEAARAAWGGSQSINYGVNSSHELLLNALGSAKGNVQPWNKAGMDALNVYSSLMGIPGYETTFSPQEYLSQTPGYQWQLGQGQKSLDASAAGRGMLLSGPQRQASQQYGQGLASNYYDKLMSSLSGLSNTGLSAGTTMGNWENQTARDRSTLQMKGAEGTVNAYDKAFQGFMAQEAVNRAEEERKRSEGNGFWDDIEGLIGTVGGIALAPFTGGTSLIGTATNALSGLFGGSSSSGGGYTPSWNNSLSQFNSSSYGR